MTPNVLTIAGFDPSAGAGVLADIKTFAAMRCYGVAAVTALTVQNTQHVQSLMPVAPELLAAQIHALFADIKISAVKIGLLASVGHVEAVAAALDSYRPAYVILDPVMRASTGAALAVEDLRGAILEHLARHVTLVTPNLAEAAHLAQMPAPASTQEMAAIGAVLVKAGFKAVLVKGGHLSGDHAADVFCTDATERIFIARRVRTRNAHGTGCTLSAAIASGLASGLVLDDAIEAAKAFVTRSLANADRLKVGEGAGPLHHFNDLW